MNAEELRRRRAALGLSQEGLARALGVTRQAVYLWERGRPILMPVMLDLALQTLERERTRQERRQPIDD